jgi:hypothetical protein
VYVSVSVFVIDSRRVVDGDVAVMCDWRIAPDFAKKKKK